MFSFFKRRKPAVPQWANYFNGTEYEIFITLVQEYFNKEQIAYSIANGIVEVRSDRFGGENSLGLSNLAQRCKQELPSEWQEIISGQFTQIEESIRLDNEFSEKAHDFSFVQQYIGVKLYHKDYARHLNENGSANIARPVTEDIICMLTFDFPHSVKSIIEEDTAKWDRSLDELFELGIQNIKDHYDVDLDLKQIGGVHCWAAEEEHFYAPNLILDIKNHPEVIGTKGCIVAIPTRHIILFYPIEDLAVIDACNTLMPIVSALYNEGPGSISDGLYWYNNASFIKLTYKIMEKDIKFSPPPAFVDLLNELGAD